MKYIILLLLQFMLVLELTAQFSYGGGLNLTRFFNTQTIQNQSLSMPGIHGHLEIPRSGDVTLYGRVSYLFPKANYDTLTSYVTAIDDNINPYILAVNSRFKTSYLMIEGGNRYYIGNDYDNGFAGYGGSGISVGIGQVRKSYESTDISGQYFWEQTHASHRAATPPNRARQPAPFKPRAFEIIIAINRLAPRGRARGTTHLHADISSDFFCANVRHRAGRHGHRRARGE